MNSGCAAIAVRQWAVGQYRCTLTMQRPRPGALTSCVFEWAPERPARLDEHQLREYRAGRDQALAEIADELGVHLAAVLEV